MITKSVFAAIGALSILVSLAGEARAEQKPMVAARAKIVLETISPDGQASRGRAGLIYGGESTILAEIQFFDAAGRDLGSSCPVVLRSRSVGLTAILAAESDGSMSLDDVDGKTPAQILGQYRGIQLDAAVILGLGGLIASNHDHVTLRNLLFQGGVGVDLSVSNVTILADSNISRTERFDSCDWNRPIRIDRNYTGGETAMAEDAAKSVFVPVPISPAQSAPAVVSAQ